MSQDRLILPPASLAGCLFGALLRDTRGRGLTGAALFNHFPASPLFSVSWVFDGRLHRVIEGQIDPEPLPAISLAGPQIAPVTSWSPGPVRALSLGIYPEAWHALTGHPTEAWVGQTCALATGLEAGPLLDALKAVASPDDLARLEADVLPLWLAVRPGAAGIGRTLGDWLRSVSLRAALGGAGKSLRQSQRQLRRLTGQNARALDLYAKVEALGALRCEAPTPLAELAVAAGFADQSHMGRAVRRVTGLSPGALNRAIASEEAFWAYRLLGEGV